MRSLYLRAVFQSVLLVAATTGGLPCYSCPDLPPSTKTLNATGLIHSAAPDAGYFLDDGGIVRVEGAAAVPLPIDLCAQACSETDVTGCQLDPGDAGAALLCDLPTRRNYCGGGGRRACASSPPKPAMS